MWTICNADTQGSECILIRLARGVVIYAPPLPPWARSTAAWARHFNPDVVHRRFSVTNSTVLLLCSEYSMYSIFVIIGCNWEVWWSRNAPWWPCSLGTPPVCCQAKRLKQRLVHIPSSQMQLHWVHIYSSSCSLKWEHSCNIKTKW